MLERMRSTSATLERLSPVRLGFRQMLFHIQPDTFGSPRVYSS